MKKLAIAAAVLVSLIALGIAAVPFAQDYAARRLKLELERDGSVRVGTVEVDLFGRAVELVDVTVGFNDEYKAGTLKMSGLAWPLGELLRGTTPFAGLRLGDPLIVGRLHLTNLLIQDVEGDSGAWTVGELVADRVNLRRNDAADDDIMYGHMIAARLLKALSVQRVAVSEIGHVSGDEATYAAAGLVIEDYQRGLLENFSLKDFQARAGRGGAALFSIGEVEAKAIDLRRHLDAMASLDWEPGAPVGRVPVARARVSGFGGEALARYGLSVGPITVETVHETAELSRTRTRVEEVVLAPSLRSIEAIGARVVMQAMKLAEVRVSFDCGVTDDRVSREVTLDGCVLSATNLVEATLTGRLNGVDEAFWRGLDSSSFQDSTANFVAAKLVIVDKSLLQRGLQAKATMSGRTVAAERAALAAEIRRYQPPDVLISEDMTRLLDTLARFVEQGGTLTIDAAPQPPFAFENWDYLLTPGADLVNALGISATVAR